MVLICARLTEMALRVADLDAAAMDHRPVAVFEIADRVGEGRQRNRVGAEIHLAAAMPDRERRAAARADHQVVFAGKDEGERESAAQTRQRLLHGVDRRHALLHLRGDELRDDFGVGLGAELDAGLFQLFAQFAEILDDAVMHDRELVGRVRMRVGLVRAAMRRPARMADAGHAGERLAVEFDFEIFQLAFGAAALEMTVLDGRDARGIVAAIFKPPQRIDQLAGNRLAPQNSDNPAHGLKASPPMTPQ